MLLVRPRVFLVPAALMLALFAGCGSYSVPGGAGDLSSLRVAAAPEPATTQAKDQQTEWPVREALDRKPLASFPVSLAVIRVQSPNYKTRTTEVYGSGKYRVVTTRDIEKDEHLQRIRSLPMVRAVTPANRLLVPQSINSDRELREMAASMQSEMLAVYTLDTTFNVKDGAAPLSVVTLGLFPSKVANVRCTASALLLDTRSGYLYGAAEATDVDDQLANSWTSEDAVDETRRRVESRAFERLVGEFEKMWTGVVLNHAPRASASR